MGAYALEVATRVDRRQCVAQIAVGCLGAEVGMPKSSIPRDATGFGSRIDYLDRSELALGPSRVNSRGFCAA
jgi:hypothetical protein